jgi:hypothetical protein
MLFRKVQILEIYIYIYASTLIKLYALQAMEQLPLLLILPLLPSRRGYTCCVSCRRVLALTQAGRGGTGTSTTGTTGGTSTGTVQYCTCSASGSSTVPRSTGTGIGSRITRIS